MDFGTVQFFFENSWQWAAGLAATMVGMTLAGLGLLNRQRRNSIAGWLAGQKSEEDWSKSFCAMFDALFGERHFSRRCFFRSSLASLLAVFLIWYLMGASGALEHRVRTDWPLEAVLAVALLLNVIIDFISLLETRWLIGQLHRFRSWRVHLAVLVGDIVLTGTLSWTMIHYWQQALNSMEVGLVETLPELVGMFSVYSILFYSAFLTSIWVWAYLLSIWIMRTFRRYRLANWLDVEDRPVLILANVLGLGTFTAALLLSVPLQKAEDGLTIVDRALCHYFGGRVCLDVATLSDDPAIHLDLMEFGCGGPLTEACLLADENLQIYLATPSLVREWQIGCSHGIAASCTLMGRVLEFGRAGHEADIDGAIPYYRSGCDWGNAVACFYMGHALEAAALQGEASPEARDFYERGCNGGHGNSCTRLAGFLAEEDEAQSSFREALERGCTLGSPYACGWLGQLFKEGIGVEADLELAGKLLWQGCEGGVALSCLHLRLMQEDVETRSPDYPDALTLLELGCDQDDGHACSLLADRLEEADPVDPNEVSKFHRQAYRLFKQECERSIAMSCASLGDYERDGKVGKADAGEAADAFERACNLEYFYGCMELAVLHENGEGHAPDSETELHYFRRACEASPVACELWVILSFRDETLPDDPAEAEKLYQDWCAAGAEWICWEYGWELLEGEKLGPSNPDAAAEMFRKACDGGYARACYALAQTYEDWLYIAGDLAEAARLYRNECDVGSIHGCAKLGYLYLVGDGVEVDYTEASTFFTTACDNENALGCAGLGYLKHHGLGLEIDHAGAMELYRMGCSGGNAFACNGLGLLHENGLGSEVNLVEATRLYQEACSAGQEAGCENLTRLEAVADGTK